MLVVIIFKISVAFLLKIVAKGIVRVFLKPGYCLETIKIFH